MHFQRRKTKTFQTYLDIFIPFPFITSETELQSWT